MGLIVCIMEAVKSLIAARGDLKARLTIHKKYVESVDVNDGIEVFEARVRMNESLLEKFDAVQSQVEAAVIGTPDEEAQLHEREQFEDIYCKIHSEVKKRLRQVQGEVSPSPAPATAGSVSSPILSAPYSAVGIPDIRLPDFTGEPSQWIRFRDTFVSLVHEAQGLSDVDRFNYLTSALSGAAARTIESFGVSAANYELAWARLKERYGDPQVLVNHYIRSLLNVEPIRKQSSEALTEFADSAINSVRALESLLGPTEFRDALLNTVLAKRLDTASLDEWEWRNTRSRAMLTFRDFAQFMEQRAQYLARKDANKPILSASSRDRLGTDKPREGAARAFLPVSHVANQGGKCALCDNKHTLGHCPAWKAMPISERRNVVKRTRACYNCLAPGHGVKTCTRETCRKYGKKHHTLLHKGGPP